MRACVRAPWCVRACVQTRQIAESMTQSPKTSASQGLFGEGRGKGGSVAGGKPEGGAFPPIRKCDVAIVSWLCRGFGLPKLPETAHSLTMPQNLR